MNFLKKIKDKLDKEFLDIENRKDLSDDEKVHQLITIGSAVCAGIAVQPIPFADAFILTPLQAYLGSRIGAVRGFSISQKKAKDLIIELSGVVGLGMLAQQVIIGVYKVGLPVLAGFTTIPLVFGATFAIGKVMDYYFIQKLKGNVISKDAMKEIFIIPENCFMPNNSEDIVYKHLNTINNQDERGYLDSVKFPFTYQNYNGVSITIKDEEDYRVNYKMPWDIIKDTEANWSHTDLDKIEEVARSNSSVVYKLLMRRINKSGITDLVIQVIWIAVYTKGEWGIQFRHNLGTPTMDDDHEYKGAIKKFIGGFKDGLRHGQGTYTYADGSITKGFFKII